MSTSEGFKGRKLEVILNILNIAVLSALIPWGTWVTKETIKLSSIHINNSQFSNQDAAVLRADIREWHNADIDRVTSQINQKLQDLHDGQVEIKVVMKQLQERVKL